MPDVIWSTSDIRVVHQIVVGYPLLSVWLRPIDILRIQVHILVLFIIDLVIKSISIAQ